MLIGQHLVVSYSGERIVQMVFIRFQYHLQRHFVVLVVARLVVDITIMQVPIATRRFVFIPMDLQDLSVGLLQVPNKQWGIVHAEQGYIIVTLPLAYSSNKYVVIGQDLDYTSNDTDGYGENVGVTQVTTTSIRVSITRGRYLSYCTIGF